MHKRPSGGRESKEVGKILLFASAAVVATTAFAGPALASHDHYLVTPGTCVGDIAKGQTAKGEGDYHKYHDNVHLGTPGAQSCDSADIDRNATDRRL